MFINPDKTYAEQADRVYTFYDIVGELRDRFGTEETDARKVNLNNIMMAANASIVTLRLMDWTHFQGQDILTQALRLTKPEYLTFVVDDLLRSSRLFLLLESQFQIESLFRNILRELGLSVTQQGYYNVANSILQHLGIADLSQKLAILNVPALMRNSMHANGIHHGWRGSSTSIVIDGIEFKFEHEKKVECGSWLHIVTALKASMKIIEEILTCTAISSLEVVHDTYSKQKSTEDRQP